MSELLHAAGYAALVYLFFNYVVTFGSGRPLVEAVNPNRHWLPLFAAGLLGTAYSLLVRAGWKYQRPQLDLLRELVTAERAAPEVVGGVAFAVFGLSVVILWAWCWWNLPRDPRTFSPNPKDLAAEYHRAIRHYVRWAGGIDYAFLCEVRGGAHAVLAEGAMDSDIERGLARLPLVGTATVALDRAKAVAEQKVQWREQAVRVFAEVPRLDDVTHPSRQGQNVTLCFDVRYGAFYFEVLERPESADGVWLYLFAATLNQHEVNSLTAGRHYYSLSAAVRHIRSGVSKK